MFSERSIYKAGKDSVSKSLDLFINTKKNSKNKIFERDIEKYKYSEYCNTIVCNNKDSIALAFSSKFSMTEMRLCLMKHDWVNLQRLFPILLKLSSDKETLIWRYALIILLYSPMSNIINFQEFINLCVYYQNDDYNYVLDQLLTLRNH